jgi:hypothetical protein
VAQPHSLCPGVISTLCPSNIIDVDLAIREREPLDIVPYIAYVHDPIAGPWEVDTLPATVDNEARRF